MGKENFEQNRLTNQADSPKLEEKGDIFMAEGNGGNGPEKGAPIPPEQKPKQPRQPKAPPSGAPQPEARTPSGQELQLSAEQRQNLEKIINDENIPIEVRRAAEERLTEGGVSRGKEPQESLNRVVSAWREWGTKRVQEGLPEEDIVRFVEDQITKGRMPMQEEKPTITEEERRAAQAELEDGRKDTETMKKMKHLTEILGREDVRLELLKPNPNLDSDSLKDLRNYFEQIDIARGGGAELYMTTQVIAGLRTKDHNVGTSRVDQASEASRRLLFEWAYEKLIGRPDLGSEEAQYKIGSFQLLNLLDEMDALSIREFSQSPGKEGAFPAYLSQLQHIREVAHELNRNLNYGEQYKEYVLKALRAEGLDFMQNDLAGVAVVIRMYEKASAAMVSKTHMQLTEGDVKNIDTEVLNTVSELHEKGILTKDGRVLTDWETKRALRIGRIVFAGTQRMAMYVGIGDINPALPASSLHSEYIVRALMPFKEVAPRFFRGPGSKRFLNLIYDEMRSRAKPDGKYIGLFGAKDETMMQSTYGASDAESHRWRSQLMFLGNVKIGDRTLLQYLTDEKNSPTDRDKDFSANVRDTILGQRLYLSVLARHVDFNPELKKVIWEKIALLKPSTMASLLPEEVVGDSNAAVWETLRKKLYIAEEARVSRDAEHYSGQVSEDILITERENFARIAQIVGLDRAWTSREWNSILRYMGMSSLSRNLNPRETELLKNVIKNGFRNASTLANAQIPFGFVIDDAPKIAWKKTGDGQAGMDPADLIRILVSDQQSYTEGWTEINGLVEYPTKDVIKHISTAVDKIGSVDGRTSAQDQLEPLIAAWMQMAKMGELQQWIPGAVTAKRAMRRPTSEMEQYYRSEFISMDAEERAAFLMALSQAKSIRDSLDKGDMVGVNNGMTQLDKLRKETGSNRMSLFIHTLRIMIMIFGPAFAMEFLKGIMPKELMG
jgi:phage-related protein